MRVTTRPAAHILVVDDDPSIREGLALALKDTYVVHSAATGEEACALLRRHQIAAIILDAVLRDEHGLGHVERFRKISPAPILVLTGYGSEDLAVRALRAKVGEYLKKPVKLPELQAALARLVGDRRRPLPPVEQACLLLSEYPERTHTTASLAKAVGVSKRHLRRQFRENYGKTPRRYLTEVRLQKAAHLLRTTSLGIEQIALQVGYQSVPFFTRLFKRAFGMSPSAFREGASRAEPRHFL